ncbi:MAG TPA: pyridoxal phosphate-dependent aminotransferase [Blastocatellia bacterium]|nr:pyridoxal phosphate-dependent aminotransferase [Blastocatellia bacterium]
MFSPRFKWNLETNRLAQALAERRNSGAEILDLTESNPTRAGFVYPADEILNALAEPRALRYDPRPQGLLTARQAVAAYYRKRGEAVDPAHICLTASTSEAYSWLFKLLADQGDNVLIPQPGYPLFDFLAALEGLELRPYELAWTQTSGWRVDFDSVRQALNERTRAIVVVTPNNPTGSFIKADELSRLNEICAAHRLALIADEVFADYALDPEASIAPALTAESEALTFVLNGLSKTLALPQMKLGWIITGGPNELRREALERLELIADTFLPVNTPVQCALPAWFELRAAIQAQILDRVRDNYVWLSDAVKDSPCRLLKVEGGWSAPLEVPRFYSEEEWTLRLLAEGVLIHPGYFFDFHREAFLVLSLLAPQSDFREAVARMLALVARH